MFGLLLLAACAEDKQGSKPDVERPDDPYGDDDSGRDEDSGEDSGNETPDPEPLCAITAPEVASVGAFGAVVTLEGDVSDAPDAPDTLGVAWSSDRDGLLGEGSPDADGRVTLSTILASAGAHLLTLRATDRAGSRCDASVAYRVDHPPVVTVDAPEAEAYVNEGEVLTLRTTVADDDDAPSSLQVHWESDRDGRLHEGPPAADGTLLVDLSGLTRGAHRLTVTVVDPWGLAASADVHVVVNGVPGASGVSISPAAPSTLDTLVASLDEAGVDPDGDPLAVTWRWSVDGVDVPALTGPDVPADMTSAGETWIVSMTTSDGRATSGVATAAVTVSNTPPTLSAVTILPDPAYEGDLLRCEVGSYEDVDGDAIGFAYAWWVDGAPAGDGSATLDGASFDRGQTVACAATPFDAADDGLPVRSAPVEIGNTAPTLASAILEPAAPTASSIVTCGYTGYADPDADPESVAYAWTVDGVRVAETSATLAGAFVGGQEVRCTVTPFDGTDVGRAVDAAVVVANTPPVLAGVTVSPAVAREADTLTCVPGAATDIDGTTPIAYAFGWTVNGVRITSSGVTLTGAEFDAGDEVVCTVTPQDRTDAGAPVASAPVVIVNTAPVLTGVSVSSATAAVGDTLTCSATATDADGDSPRLTFAWSNGATGASIVLTAADDPGTLVTCTATATDVAGEATSGSSSARVTNTAPVLAGASVTPGAGRVGDTLVCASTVTDADGGTPALSFAWSNGTTGAAVVLAASDDPGVPLVCTVTASDVDGGSDARTVAATVLNSDPVIAGVGISPASPTNTDTLVCTSSVTDPDGGSPLVDVAWRNERTGATVGAGPSLALTTSLAAPGDALVCEVSATDADGGVASARARVTVQNRAPTARATLTPTTPTRASTLLCTGSASDDDGDSTSLSFSWTVGGRSVSATTTSAASSSLAGVFASGDTVTCEVTAADGRGGTGRTPASVRIGNSLPAVSSVGLTPSTLRTNDTASATVVHTDPDGDPVAIAYAWFVNGTRVVGATGATLSGVTAFNKGDSVYVEVTPSDAAGAGAAVRSSTVVVANSGPTTPALAISPRAPVACNDRLVCGLTSAPTDPDGDPVTLSISWTVDGVATSGSATTTYAADTMTPYDTAYGDVWACSVRASDGSASATATSATVTIGAPTAVSAGTWEVEANRCGDGAEWVDSAGRVGEAGYVELRAWSCSAQLLLHEGLNSTCRTAVARETPTAGWGMSNRGAVHVGSAGGACPGGWGGTSASGVSLSTGWMMLHSTGNVLFSIDHDDCGGAAEGCPAGFTRAGRTHVGGGCDGWPNGVSYTGRTISSGWMALCVADGSATLTGTNTCP